MRRNVLEGSLTCSLPADLQALDHGSYLLIHTEYLLATTFRDTL